jgi:pSer/pThr/pTyr-binding forkhead associated (FHA) protein
MLKCPFCGFDNEDGALFCEQCKSDLGGVAAAAPAEAVPMAADIAFAEAAPVVAEAAPAFAEAAPAAPAPAPAAPAPAAGGALPPGAQPKLVVQRGLKINFEYPIYEGQNFIGRADEKPVDIDLEDQEPPDRIWSSRQHAVIFFEGGTLSVEDLNSSNGTFVNRNRIYPGQKTPLNVNDVIQIGTVQLRVKI